MPSITRQLKDLISDFVVDGDIMEKQLGKTVKKNLSRYRIQFIVQFIDLLLNTDFISEETKVYISDRYLTLDGARKKIGGNTNLNTLKAKVWYDKNKIVREFGDRFLVDIIDYNNIDIASYVDKLGKLRRKYYSDIMLKGLALEIKLDDLPAEEVEELNDEEFEELINVIAPYSRKHMDYLANNLTRKSIMYMMYILNNYSISNKDLERRKLLMDILD